MKTKIHTRDIFISKDSKKAFDSCRDQALKSGLTCRCVIDGNYRELELWGTKTQFIKYYLRTITKWKRKFNGFKRLMDIIALSN